MTIAEYFASLPRGSIKGVAARLGYSQIHLYRVISGQNQPSFFMANSLATFSNGQIDMKTITIGKKGNHHAHKN